MNIHLLKEHISNYKRWIKANEAKTLDEKKERDSLSQQYQLYTRERILSMTSEDVYNYIAPLWAMLIWGNKQYVIDKLIANNTLQKLTQQLANLMWGNDKIEKRWDTFRKEIKGMGPAMMSELLSKTHPNEFLIWNRRALIGFSYLEVENTPKHDYQINGQMYAYLCEQGKEIGRVMREENIFSTDLLAVDYFIWQELQIQPSPQKLSIEEFRPEEKVEISKKEAEFIHNDIRDKLKDVGLWLGFEAEVEKKVADGAVVDAIWEVTIGNMGRVIYVFEVQTSGSIDSLILNLMKAKNNKAVQGIVAVTDQKQIEKIKKEVATLHINGELKFWDYTEVLKVHESLQYVNESINNLGLVPHSL